MSLGLAFWIIMMVWLVFGLLTHFAVVPGMWGATANVVLLFVLFTILGWQTFGAPLRRGA
jgi:uncharacterized membrane protein